MPIGGIPELCVPECTIHIDSKVLDAAEDASVADADGDEGDGGGEINPPKPKTQVEAVNGSGAYGEWRSDVSYDVADVDGIVGRYML